MQYRIRTLSVSIVFINAFQILSQTKRWISRYLKEIKYLNNSYKKFHNTLKESFRETQRQIYIYIKSQNKIKIKYLSLTRQTIFTSSNILQISCRRFQIIISTIHRRPTTPISFQSSKLMWEQSLVRNELHKFPFIFEAKEKERERSLSSCQGTGERSTSVHRRRDVLSHPST